MKRIAILGCGTIGRRVAELIVRERARLAAQIGTEVQLARVLVRDVDRPRGVDPALLTSRFETILEDRSIDLAIEVLGGAEPAATFAERLLNRGVDVVTANKTMVAHHGERLRAAAVRGGAALAGEASVCAAVPVLGALRALRGDRVRRIRGVINGTCGFILSRMASQECSLADAVAEAQRRGFAERDPAADLSGRDAAEKLCILAASIGLRCWPDQVERFGIESIRPTDLKLAREWGCALVPLAELGTGGARVCPTLVPRCHPFAGLDGAENAVEIDSDLGGRLLLRGQGAGPNPTASAIIGDAVATLRRRAGGHLNQVWQEPLAELSLRVRRQPRYIRIALDGHEISPERLTDAFALRGIEIDRIEWRRDAAAALTRAATHAQIATVIDDLDIRDPSQVFCADVCGEESDIEINDLCGVIELIEPSVAREQVTAA